MLNSIEMWDFESHEHTLVDDLSAGLNLVCGESNAGKTAIVRALRLVAYNEFDPKSLRVGAKWCRVRVVSDKGVVQVTRGPKDNLWEITENGKPTKPLDKIGVQVVPEACKVLGLGIVRLGDTDVPVNIMDQLESHFMLSGIGETKATGSVRAQIIDEISGLSGIEGVIKSVSLDNTRFGRDVKRLEKEIDKTRSQLHDQNALDREATVLEKAEAFLKEREECLLAHGAAESLLVEHKDLAQRVQDLEAQLRTIPDLQQADESIRLAEDGFDVVSSGRQIVLDMSAVKNALTNLHVELGRIGDVDGAQSCLARSEVALSRMREMARLWSDLEGTTSRISTLSKQLRGLPDEMKAQTQTDRCLDLLSRARSCASLLKESHGLNGEFALLDGEMKRNAKELNIVLREQDEALKSVTVCPLNLRPVLPECLKGVRTPVIKEKP